MAVSNSSALNGLIGDRQLFVQLFHHIGFFGSLLLRLLHLLQLLRTHALLFGLLDLRLFQVEILGELVDPHGNPFDLVKLFPILR